MALYVTPPKPPPKVVETVTRNPGGSGTPGTANYNPPKGQTSKETSNLVFRNRSDVNYGQTAAQVDAAKAAAAQTAAINLDQAVAAEQARLTEKYGSGGGGYTPTQQGAENIARNIILYGSPISPSTRTPLDLQTYRAYEGPDISQGLKNIAQNQASGYYAQDKTGMVATSAGPSPFRNQADVTALHERDRLEGGYGGAMAGEYRTDTAKQREDLIKFGGNRLIDRLAQKNAPRYDFSGAKNVWEAKERGVLDKSFDVGKIKEGEKYGLNYTPPTAAELLAPIEAEKHNKFVEGLIEKNKDNPENLRMLEAVGLITLKRDPEQEARINKLIEENKDNPEKLRLLESLGLVKLQQVERSPEEKAKIEKMIEENRDNPEKLKEMEKMGLITMAAPLAVGGAGVGGVGGVGVGGETQTLTKLSKTSEYAQTGFAGGAAFFGLTGPLQTAAMKSKSWTGFGINVGTFVTGAVSMIAGKASGEGYSWAMPQALSAAKKAAGVVGSTAENVYNYGVNTQMDIAKRFGIDTEKLGVQRKEYVTPESSSWAKTITEPVEVAVGYGPATPALAPIYALSRAEEYGRGVAAKVAPSLQNPEPLGIVKSGVSAAENLSLAVARKFETATGWNVVDKERQPVNAQTSTWLQGLKDYTSEQTKPTPEKTVEERIIGIGRPAVELGGSILAAEYVGAMVPTYFKASNAILNQKLSLSLSTPRTATIEGFTMKAGETSVDDLTVLSIRKGSLEPNVKLGIGWKTLNEREAGWVEAGGKDFIPDKSAPVGANKYVTIDKAGGEVSSYQWEKAKPRMWADDTKVQYPNLVTRGSKLKAEFTNPAETADEITRTKGLTQQSNPQMERQFVESSEKMTRATLTQEYPKEMMATDVDFEKSVRIFKGEPRAGAVVKQYMRENPDVVGFGGSSRVAHQVSETTGDIDQQLAERGLLRTRINPFASNTREAADVAQEEAARLKQVSDKFAVSKENPRLVVRTDIKGKQPHALDIHGPDSPEVQEGITLDKEYFMYGFPISHDATQVGGVSFRKLFIEGQALHGAATMPEVNRFTPFTPEETLFWKRDLKFQYEEMGGKYGPVENRLKDVTSKYDIQGGLNTAGEKMGNPQAKAAEEQRRLYAEAADYKFRGAEDRTGKTYTGLTDEQVTAFYTKLQPKPTLEPTSIFATSAIAPRSMYMSPSTGSPYSSSVSPSLSSMSRSMLPPSSSPSPSVSISPSIYASPSVSPSPSHSPSPSIYPSPSVSPYLYPSPSASPSPSTSTSPSPSVSPSVSPSMYSQPSGFSQLGGFSSGGGGGGKGGKTTGDRYSIRNPWRTAESFKEKVIGGRRRF
jgi:hypothetical protein